MSGLRIAAVAAGVLCLACREGERETWVRAEARQPGELALPPSANAPRVRRDDLPPDTLAPDTLGEFAILAFDSLTVDAALSADGGPNADGGLRPGVVPDIEVESIAEAYRSNYAQVLQVEGSAVEGRIDRELQHEAELRTARDRGFGDWTELIGALSPEGRARLVDRLNEANVDLARELHGSSAPTDPAQPPG